VVAKKAKISFENFPVCPSQFVILDLESEKKAISCRRARHKRRAFCFWFENHMGRNHTYPSVGGYEEEKGKGQDGG
jgi:hypothetical protein